MCTKPAPSVASAFAATVRSAIAQATTADDAVTADLFTEISRAADQFLRFVKSPAR